MAVRSSYFDAVFRSPAREQLLTECPALQLIAYQHVTAVLLAHAPLSDPLARGSRKTPRDGERGTAAEGQAVDAVGEMLSMPSISALLDRAFAAAASPQAGSGAAFWRAMAETLEAAWAPPQSLPVPSASPAPPAEAAVLLASISGQPHYISAEVGAGEALPAELLRNATESSRRFLRSVTTCALSGSVAPLGGKQPALSSVIQFAGLVPPGAAEAGEAVTSGGLNYSMMSLQQQCWVLVSGAVDRVLALTEAARDAVTLPRLWQLLAVLATLDTSARMFPLPGSSADPAGYQLVVRLSEVGMTYLYKKDGSAGFIVSPMLRHALEWQATAPVCASVMLGGVDGGATTAAAAGGCRREDADTIITETNFRLYAYTRNDDLLHIIDQFAEREERVNNLLVCYRITRPSFVAALRKGISAAQVLQFLSLRAHPSMLHRYGEDAHASLGLHAGSSDGSGQAGGRVRGLGSAGSIATSALAIPQSVCDQLFMWESECRRVVFHRNVVMLRGLTAEQLDVVVSCLTDVGQEDAVVHRERGCLIVQEEVYKRFLADAVEASSPPNSA